MQLKLKSIGSFLSACALTAVLATFSAPAKATLIVAGDTVIDPTTNLQWLDASFTRNMSPNQALAANPGYQLATWAQVQTMFEDNGIPASVLPNTLYDPSNFLDLAAPLLSLFNYSILSSGPPALPPLGSSYETRGNVLDTSGTTSDLVDFTVENALFQQGILIKLLAGNNLDNSGGDNFDFLVQATPVPPSLVLFASGLLGLFVLRHRRLVA